MGARASLHFTFTLFLAIEFHERTEEYTSFLSQANLKCKLLEPPQG
jgi:hypothetical protein